MIQALIMSNSPTSARSGRESTLVKHHLASVLKEEIVHGRLAPGQRIVEGKWARQFGVAQASVREAINLLLAEGFVTKNSGRSARVIRYTEQDVARIYEVRAALEGMAAHLVAQNQPDLAPLHEALDQMRAAIETRDVRRLIESDGRFHLSLCELSGNQFLCDLARRTLAPLFAFVLLRVLISGQGPEAWVADLGRHQHVLDMLREGDPALAEQYVRRALRRFASSAYAVWDNVGGSVEAHLLGRQLRSGTRSSKEKRSV